MRKTKNPPNPPWEGRRVTEALEQVRAAGSLANEPCWLCKTPINYNLRHPDLMSCSVQHVRSQRDWPHLRWEPTNWKPAHLRCNLAAGADASRHELGATTF